MTYRLAVRVWGAALVLGLLAGCGGNRPAVQSADPRTIPDAAPTPGLPDLGQLDALRDAAAVQDHEVPVTEPIAGRYTEIAGASLEFLPPADELAYALYRIDPPGPPLSLSAAGEGPLWLLVADYGTGTWRMEPFVDGAAEIDLTELVDLFSPDEYMYSAVICPAGESGRLDSMTLAYDEFDWGLTISADDQGITLHWNELDADSYEVYRSTLAADEAPYHVATVDDQHSGGNSFTESVPEDQLGRWVPENNDNGTPTNTSDDFPTIAPEVNYYYRLTPVVDGHRYPQSPEVSDKAGWGSRWRGQRDWPDTTAQTRSIGRKLKPRYMTDAQIQWIAEHLAGLIEITQDEADLIRAYNPGFIVLGEHSSCFDYVDRHGNAMTDILGNECYNELVYGNEVDLDNIYPYVHRHEDWFVHSADSNYPNHRVLSEAGEYLMEGYWLDPDSQYMDYLAADLPQLLGEYHFDGFTLADYAPCYYWTSSQFWPGDYIYEDFAAYWRPKALAMLTQVTAAVADHPRKPAVLAHTWDLYWWGKGEMDYGPCDGIVVEEFIASWHNWWSPGAPRTMAVLNTCLAEQQAGKALILNSNMPPDLFDDDITSVLACYLLIRGSKAYLYYPGIDETTNGFTGTAPIWYPALGIDTGAPLDPLGETIEDYLAYDEFGTPYYRRDFENCSVIFEPSYHTVKFDATQYNIKQALVNGGGIVGDDGTTPGTLEWVQAYKQATYYEFTGNAYVVRGLPPRE